MQNVAVNRGRALLVCTHPSDYAPTRAREAAKHLLARVDASEEPKQLASEALKGVQSGTEETCSSPPLKARVSRRQSQ
jgi:hypothetical protein